jgi:hypothetical protein
MKVRSIEIHRKRTFVEEVFVAGHIVAQEVARLPSSKEREARSQLNVNSIIQLSHVTGGDVANLVSVVDVSSRCWQGSLQEKIKLLTACIVQYILSREINNKSAVTRK